MFSLYSVKFQVMKSTAYILFWIKWSLMFTGCLLHCLFPVRGFAHPADPRSDPSWSNERNRVLPHPSVGQTGQGTGKKL